MAIDIKPSHKGLFHKDVGKKEGQRITESDIRKGKRSKNPAERKRAVFAENARHFHHGKRKKSHSEALYGGEGH